LLGNPEDWSPSITCSLTYPGVKLTKREKYVPEFGFRISDQRVHLKDVTLINFQPTPCQEVGEGAWVAPIKGIRPLPPDSIYSDIKFSNTWLTTGPRTNSSNKEKKIIGNVFSSQQIVY
jgi:hypothetical protein